MSATLTISSLQKTYGSGPDATVALKDIGFEVRQGEFLCVVGPSGCGKTTLLNCISGLMPPSAGVVAFGGERIREPLAEMAMVLQDYSRSLYPWFTVEQNIALPLKAKGVAKAERRKRVGDAIEAVGLGGAANKRPYELSGGMQQRVAIARALAYQPTILLMDEPFASIDAQTRAELEDLTLRTRDFFDVTVLFVTHDIDEAVYLGDRIVVLTRPPTTVAEVVTVDLPRPRDQIATKELSEFTSLRTHVFRSIREGGRPAAKEAVR